MPLTNYKPVLSIPAGRIRAPFMGLPVPGERPLVFVTEQVRAALKGVTITDTALLETKRAANTGEDDYNRGVGEKVRALEITYRHGPPNGDGLGRNRGRVVLYDRADARGYIAGYKFLRLVISEWAEKQREKRAKQADLPTTARGKRIAIAIRRLEREKGKLLGYSGKLHRPVHPFLHREGYTPEPHRAEDGHGGHGETILAWYREKSSANGWQRSRQTCSSGASPQSPPTPRCGTPG